jgi:hypothetical protein
VVVSSFKVFFLCQCFLEEIWCIYKQFVSAADFRPKYIAKNFQMQTKMVVMATPQYLVRINKRTSWYGTEERPAIDGVQNCLPLSSSHGKSEGVYKICTHFPTTKGLRQSKIGTRKATTATSGTFLVITLSFHSISPFTSTPHLTYGFRN